jgi:hypothetical protein
MPVAIGQGLNPPKPVSIGQFLSRMRVSRLAKGEHDNAAKDKALVKAAKVNSELVSNNSASP